MPTSQGEVALVCPESPEAWIEDYGDGEIINGQCRIDLDQRFLDCVTVNEQHPLKVFIQLTSSLTQQFYVEKGTTGFDVIVTGENAQTASATFDFRVVGKWRNYEDMRFEPATQPPEVIEVGSVGQGQIGE
jgi:hypothetical protein